MHGFGCECDVNHPIDSTDSDEPSGGESDLAYDCNQSQEGNNVDTSPEVVIFVTQQCLKYPRLTGRAVVQLIIEKGNDEVGGEPRKMAFRHMLLIYSNPNPPQHWRVNKQGTLLAGFLFVCGLIQSSSPNKLIITGETFSVPSYILLSAIELFLLVRRAMDFVLNKIDKHLDHHMGFD
ncbi:hypothetical protein V6N13_054119 [Hibiscus sabdariffa]